MQELCYDSSIDNYQRSKANYEIDPGEIVKITLLNRRVTPNNNIEFNITNDSDDKSIIILKHSTLYDLFCKPDLRLVIV
jgi:hypothetical protein